MDDSIDKEKLKAFLNNTDGHYAELADLPFWWDNTPPDARDPELPNYSRRQMLLASYSNWAFTKPWAWEGLRRLLDTLTERREPIPDTLQLWANAAASGRRKPPDLHKRGRKDETERDVRIIDAIRVMRQVHGYSRQAAMQEIARAINVSFDTVRSAVRRVDKAQPFRRGEKNG